MFDLFTAKLRRPLLRPGTVRRSSLIERLARGGRRPIVSVVAPAGYGKTTVLAQWAERNGQAFAWVSVDEADNDPKVLLTYVAKALDAVEPVGERVFDALASPGSSVPGSVVPRLGSAFSSMASPVALILDDVHALHNSECRAALSVLADHVPGGSRLVLAGRAEPPLPIARLRAEGRLLEVGPGDLSLTCEEASSLLRNVDLTLGEDDVAELHRRTEGWPAGLYLAALYLKEGGPFASAAVSFGGDDRLVSEYLESEFLARISRRHRTFLTRTAVLERMCGPLCDAVLDMSGSTAALADLERSNLLLVPLDRRGDWYRYHHLFRDMLLAELHRQEPDLMPVLQRRAAQWYERNREPEEALEYWMKAGEVDSAARLVGALAFLSLPTGQDRDGRAVARVARRPCGHGKLPGDRRPGGDVLRLDREAGPRRTMGRRRRAGSRRHEPAGREPVNRAVAGADPGAAVPRRGGADAGRRGARGHDHGPGQLLADHRHDVPGGRAPDGRRSRPGRCPVRGCGRGGPGWWDHVRSMHRAGRAVAAGDRQAATGIWANGTCPRPGRWPVRASWRTIPRSRSCTRWPRGWRCTRPTVRAPRRN